MPCYEIQNPDFQLSLSSSSFFQLYDSLRTTFFYLSQFSFSEIGVFCSFFLKKKPFDNYSKHSFRWSSNQHLPKHFLFLCKNSHNSHRIRRLNPFIFPNHSFAQTTAAPQSRSSTSKKLPKTEIR